MMETLKNVAMDGTMNPLKRLANVDPVETRKSRLGVIMRSNSVQIVSSFSSSEVLRRQ